MNSVTPFERVVRAFVKLLSYVFLIFGVFINSLAAAPFTNGNFDTGPSCTDAGSTTIVTSGDTCGIGWSVHDTGYRYARGGGGTLTTELKPSASDGYIYFLNSPSAGGPADGIKQTFDTISGTTYRVTFSVRGDQHCQAAAPGRGSTSYYTTPEENLRVTVNGTGTLYDDHFEVPLYTDYADQSDWTENSFIFTADSSATTLIFIDENENYGGDNPFCDAVLDDVSVVETINPALISVQSARVFVDTATAFSSGSSGNAKMIPGNDVIVETVLQNTGGDGIDDGYHIHMSVDNRLSYKNNSTVITEGDSPSGVAVTAIQFANATGTGGACNAATFGYTPSGAYDANVRCVRLVLNNFNGYSGSGSPPHFAVQFTAKIN